MAWIETIKICMGRGRWNGVLETIGRELAEAPDLDWDIYRHSTVAGDALIVLRWQGESPTHPESDLAVVLIRELKNHGLVDHSAWIDIGAGQPDLMVKG